MNSFNTSSHLVLCLPRLLVPSTLPNIISFSIPLALIVCPKKVSACLAIMPSNEIPGFISSKRAYFLIQKSVGWILDTLKLLPAQTLMRMATSDMNLSKTHGCL